MNDSMMHTKKNRVSDSTSNVYRILALFFAFLSFLFSLAGLAFLNSKNSIYDQPELIKNVVFIIIGLGGLSGAWWLYRMHKWRLKQVRNYPNEPWMWNPSWSKGLGQNEYSVRFLSLFIAGSFFLGVGGFALIQVWPQILKTPPLFLLLIFPALGLLLIFFSLKMLHAERKFGTSKCHLNTRPGFLGEELFVTIEIPYNFSQRASFKAHLSNTYTYSSGSGNSRHSHTDTLWSSHQSGQVPPHQPKTEIPLRFIIPTDAQPTKSEGSAQYDWTVEIYIPLPGADYQQSFRVPVFFDPQRSSTHNLTKEDLEGQEDQRSLQGFVRADLLEVQVKHLASGATRYSF
ncbi:MAG: hypothetical protein KDD61_09470, partial [Bdellovibrionales bacterium]|nr:hypothetical protein [Bdellovibrionales bacterium]